MCLSLHGGTQVLCTFAENLFDAEIWCCQVYRRLTRSYIMHVGMGHCKHVVSVRRLLGLLLVSLHNHGFVVFRLELPPSTASLRRLNAMEPARLTIRTVCPVVQEAPKAGQNRNHNCRIWVLSVFHLKQRCSLIHSVRAGTCSGRRVCPNVLNLGPSWEIWRTARLPFVVLFCSYFVGSLRITKFRISVVEWKPFHIICAYFTNRQASTFISHDFAAACQTRKFSCFTWAMKLLPRISNSNSSSIKWFDERTDDIKNLLLLPPGFVLF